MVLASLLIGLLTLALAHARKPDNAVLLSNVKSLTLRDGKLTTGRRVDPIPQISCVGGTAKGLYKPDIIRCTNAGSSYDTNEIEWTCTSSLPPEFKLGSTDVVCEGYDSSDDQYILKGSCGVEYRLMLTSAGEEKYGSGWKRKMQKEYGVGDGNDVVSCLFWAIFIGVVVWMAYNYWKSSQDGSRRRPVRRGGGYGGGDDGGNDDPPPPYEPYPKSKPSSSTYTRSYPRASTRNPNPQQGWRPGFWTGAAAGAAGTWFAGRQGRQQQPAVGQRSNNSWFGGAHDPEEGSSNGRRGGGSSFGSGGSPSYSSERYTSTGFGSTRNR